MSIKIPQAFLSKVLNGNLGIDLVVKNVMYYSWNGTAYTSVNGTYTPDINRSYIEMVYLPSEKNALSLAHSDENKGVFELIINVPFNNGWQVARNLVDSLALMMPISSIISYEGQDVVIDKHTESNGTSETFYSTIWRVEYTAFTPR